MHHKVIAIQLAASLLGFDQQQIRISRARKDFMSQSGPTPVLLAS
jgi:hypothetical protein